MVGGFVFGSEEIGDGVGAGVGVSVGMVMTDGEGGNVGVEGVGAFLFSFRRYTNSVVKAPATNASTTMPKMMKKIIDLLDFRCSDSSIKESKIEMSSE